MVKVRFAPSLTGSLHLGSARVALVNHFFAKKERGLFLLRIDDTNKEEGDAAFLKDITRLARWLGVEWQKEIKQSDRSEQYKKALKELTKGGFVEEDGGVFYFLIKKSNEAVSFSDEIYGKRAIKMSTLKSFPLAKKTEEGWRFFYNFSSVVDDFELGITHIIRGADHLTNSFQQVLLYKALSGGKEPKFVHVPNVFCQQGGKWVKMSKKDPSSNLDHLVNLGILKETLVDYLRVQSLKDVGTSNLLFNLDQLKQNNKRIIAKLSHIEAQKYVFCSDAEWQFIKQGSLTLTEIREKLNAIKNPKVRAVKTKKLVAKLALRLAEDKDIDLLDKIKASTLSTDLMSLVRKSLWGSFPHSPSIDQFFEVFKKDQIREALRSAI